MFRKLLLQHYKSDGSVSLNRDKQYGIVASFVHKVNPFSLYCVGIEICGFLDIKKETLFLEVKCTSLHFRTKSERHKTFFSNQES